MDLVAKREEITLVLSTPDVDLWKLRELCLTEGGLVDDTLRKWAWPKLVGLHGSEMMEQDEKTSPSAQSSLERSGRSRIPRPEEPPGRFQFEGVDDAISKNQHDDDDGGAPEKKKRLVECLDADQIDRDVARCTWHLLTGSQRSRRLQMENKHRKKVACILRRKQVRLSNFINLTLVQANATLPEEDSLRYYQGFHDVASVFLSSLGGGGSGPVAPSASHTPLEMIASSMGLDLASKVLGQVAKSHFRDAMRSNFMQLQSALRLVLFPLLARFDPEVHAHLYYCDMEPFFALSWIITWFSHDIRDTALVKRLFDAFIVSHPLFPLYLSAAMILHPINRAEILSTDCDFASVHQTLANLPKNSSMVGWRFQVKPSQESDVSGDEVSTASTDMDSTFLSEDLLDFVDGDGSLSSLSGGGLGSSSRGTRVPFQELIDMALSYMRRVPPRKLMGLAKRYFAEDPTREILFEQAKSISLLQSPPTWGLAATTPADWVLKQRLRESRGMKSTNRRDRRRSRSRTRSSKNGTPSDVNDIEEISRYLEEKQRTLAVIASGYGPGDDDEERRRKRRKMLMWGAVAVALVAVSYAVVTQYSPTTSTPSIGSTGGTHSGTIERDLLEASERPNKTVPRVESTAAREQTSTNRPTREGARPTLQPERPHHSRMESGSTTSRPMSAEFEVNPRGSVNSIPPVTRPNAAKSREAASTSAPRGAASPSRMTSTSRRPTETMSSPPKHSTTGSGRTTSTESVVHGPVRYVKGLFLQTRQSLSGIDRLPASQWVQGVYHDARRAVNDLDPNLILPGASLVPDFLRKARRSISEGQGAQYVKETINDTTGKGRHLVRDALKKVHRFFRKNGQGARAIKSARKELAENEAEVVVL